MVPPAITFEGCWLDIVFEGVFPCTLVSGVAQLLQNRAESVLSDWQLGHLMATADPCFQVWLKVIKERGTSQLKADLSPCNAGVTNCA
jgi:hypothetical protein